LLSTAGLLNGRRRTSAGFRLLLLMKFTLIQTAKKNNNAFSIVVVLSNYTTVCGKNHDKNGRATAI
jgi:hypothetical protein